MYLLTTPARSTPVQVRARARAASTWGRHVLPAPLELSNSAVTPRPIAVSREKPQSSRTSPRWRACASTSRRWRSVRTEMTRSSQLVGERERAQQLRRAGQQQPPADLQDRGITGRDHALATATSAGRKAHSVTGRGGAPGSSEDHSADPFGPV